LFELAKTVHQFGAEHLLIKERASMSIPVLSGNRPTILHNQIGSLFQKTAKGANTSVGLQIEGYSLMYASLPKMAVVPTLVAVLSQQSFVITQVTAKHSRMHRSVLPAFMRD